MDDETREALELSKVDLVAMLRSGEPAPLLRSPPDWSQAPPTTATVTVHSPDAAVDQALHTRNEGAQVVRRRRRLTERDGGPLPV